MQRFGLRSQSGASENAAAAGRAKASALESRPAPNTKPLTRAALGEVNRNVSALEKGVGGKDPEIKKTGYGAQGQSRLLSRPPLRKDSSIPTLTNTTTTTTGSGLVGTGVGAVGVGGGRKNSSVFADKACIRPVTRASARASSVSLSSAAPPAPKTPEDVEMPSPGKVSVSPMATEDVAEITEDAGSASSYSSSMIPDIDEGDEEDPQQAAAFANDIFKYLRYYERSFTVSEDFLRHKTVTPRMRGILIDWLHQVHNRFHLLAETMYLTVHVVDRYLEMASVGKDQLQLVGVTGMLIASKYEEMYAPEINDFVYITDDTYTAKQILAKELQMLSALGCQLGRPLPIHFLRRFSKASGADATLHTMAKYLMESSSCDYSMASVLPSHIAGAALLLASALLHRSNGGQAPIASLWTPTLSHYSQGIRAADLLPTLRKMAKHLLKVHSDKTKLQAVRAKFSSPKFAKVTSHAAFHLDNIKLLAE